MKRSFLAVLLTAGLCANVFLAKPSHAQGTYHLAPPGGITLKNVFSSQDGWGIVLIADTFPQLNTCSPLTMGSSSYTQVMWIDISASGSAGKQVYAMALSALLTGKKLEGITVAQYNSPGWCDLRTIRLAQ